MNWVIVAYYTESYKEYASKLLKSLLKFNLNHNLMQIEDLNSWQRNAQYKPTFIKNQLIYHFPLDAVYIDIDAEFIKYPELFDNFDMNGYSIAACLLDHSKFKNTKRPSELLSGTLYFRNTVETLKIIDQWIEECKKNSTVWDQVILARIIGDNFYHLPLQYCKIFDYPDDIVDPIIVQHQASRKFRNIKRKEMTK